MLKRQLLLSSLCLFASLSSQALDLPFKELRFANRAQCAVDSEIPTQSAFVLLDSYNAGRVASNAAKYLKLDAEESAKTAMEEFRLSSSTLLQLILQKLGHGQLPLLPTNVDVSQRTMLSRYQSLALGCESDPLCPSLRAYLQTVWEQSSLPTAERLKNLRKIDNFQAIHFLNLPTQPSCSLLKRFSPLQAPLHTTGVNAAQLESIAQTAMNSADFIASCTSTAADIDSRNVALQIELPFVVDKEWKTQGFDFWNSVKIYMSWAWRYAPEMKASAPRFGSLLRTLDLEESLLFMPNGCKSMTLPQCDNQTLAVNAIRELAKKTGTLTEFDELVPTGPAQNLIDRGARAVNDDFLGTMSYEKASDWVANFRQNFVETRWIMKNKLFNANQNVTAIAAHFSPTDLAEEIKAMLLEPGVTDQVRNEAAYMCLEWRLSSDNKLDFLRSDIDRVTQLQTMANMNTTVGLSTEKQIAFFQAMSRALEPVCNGLEQSQFFRRDGYKTDWSGLEPWAKEMTSSSLPQIPQAAQFVPTLVDGSALLSFGTPATVICANGMDCARKIFKAGVDLFMASTYAEAFLPVSSTPLSADVFNPYAELKACKVYDPWFQTNRVRKVFIADLINTAVVGWSPIPLYMDVNFSAPKVTSFNQLLKDGKIKFDPNLKKSKMLAALVADFGPLLGSPCAIQLAPNADKQFDFYAFNGISVNYCNVKAKHSGTAEKPDEVKMSEPKSSSVCSGCALNFVGVASGASSMTGGSGFNPLKFGVYLFRAIYRFFQGMKDKTNIPKTYTINLERLVETYKANGNKIPEDCVSSLSEGFRCYKDLCASKLADAIESEWKMIPTSVKYHNDSSRGSSTLRKRATVTFKECGGSTTVDFSCQKTNGSRFWADLDGADVSRACKQYLRGRKP